MKKTVLILSCVLLAAPIFAQKPADFAIATPGPVGGGTREVLPTINYSGGVPAPVVDALEGTDATYNRQVGDCAGPSGTGTAVFFDELPIVDLDGSPIDLVAVTSGVGTPGTCGTLDTFLTLYSPSFNPADSNLNCITSNDDGGQGADGLCSGIAGQIPTQGTGSLVIGSFSNGATGDYQVNFEGTVPVGLLDFNVD